jgi:hypothetical protein
MGIVHRARDDSLDRDAAVKILRECYLADTPELAANPRNSLRYNAACYSIYCALGLGLAAPAERNAWNKLWKESRALRNQTEPKSVSSR